MTDQPRTGATTLRRKLILVGVSLVFSALLAEGLVRLVGQNPFSAEESELLVHVATQPPNAQRTYMGPYAKGPPVVFRTSARGYILPARRGVAGARTVVFFGGGDHRMLWAGRGGPISGAGRDDIGRAGSAGGHAKHRPLG